MASSFLGYYTYNGKSARNFEYTHHEEETETTYFFQVSDVNNSVAVLKFYDPTYTMEISIPKFFSLFDSNNRLVPAYEKGYFMTWLENYKMTYKGAVILLFETMKTQNVISGNGLGVKISK